jgi:O-antigen ligase
VYSTPQLVVLAVLLGAAAIGAVAIMPSDAFSSDGVRLLLVCGSVLLALLFTLRRTNRKEPDRVGFRLGLVLWWFLLCSEAFFPRGNNGEENAASGRFSLTAYSEAIFWVFLAVCLATVLSRHWRRMASAMRSRSALSILLASICFVSVAWAPEKSFSLAWSLKLFLGVCVATYCAASLRSLRDLRSLLVVAFAAFAFLTLVPVIEGTLNPSSAFGGTNLGRQEVIEQGRFHSTAHPLVIAGRAGIMSLLALMFYSLDRKRKTIAVALGCAVIIGLAGAKTALLATAISIGFFFALRRRVLAGFTFVAALGGMALLIVSMTSVGSYLHLYLQNGELMTLSGRTDLWTAAWPEMTSHLALGHGYVASKLVSMQVGIPWYAGHMHNALLESLYNNGLVGLFILLAMNYFIVRDLVDTYRRTAWREIRLVAISLLALYLFLFLNGLTEPYFGGQASAFYLLFLSLLGMSDWLRAYSTGTAPGVSETKVASARLVASPAFRQT